LKPGEVEFLAKNTSAALSEFERISESMGKSVLLRKDPLSLTKRFIHSRNVCFTCAPAIFIYLLATQTLHDIFTSDFYFSFLQVLVKNCWQSLDRKWKKLKDNTI
jgi:hypothetical protein